MALTIPDFEAYLQSLGVGAANDSGSRYITDAQGEQQRLSQGMLDEMMGNDLTGYQQAQIAAQGYVPLEPLQDVSWFNQNYGTNFGGGVDYANWMYGPGGTVETGPDGKQYFKTPNGTSAYVNQPLKYVAPDSTGLKLTKALVGGIALGGLGGFLPGTESIFGAAAGGAGAGAGGAGAAAAEAAAPAFVGGASGAGVAGGALGGTLSGLTTAELAALGIGGAGAASAAGGSGAFNFADYINSGVLPSGSTSAIPAIPGAGNGVGLMEAALNGLKSGNTSLLSSLLGSGGGDTDWAQILNALGPAVLGIAGADAQGDAYSDVADKYLALGAPYRDKLAGSYAPGFDLATADPAFQGALDQSAQAASRAWSARAGNPQDNPGVQSEINKYVLNSSYLPQLNTYRSQLGSFGQLGTNVAGTNDTQAAGQTTGMYNAAGFGLDQLTKQQNPYEQAMKGLLGQFGKLNQPGYL